jgi:hypothetical protein
MASLANVSSSARLLESGEGSTRGLVTRLLRSLPSIRRVNQADSDGPVHQL